MVDWQWIAACLCAGMLGGLAFWLLASAALAIASRVPQRLPFAADVLSGSGDRDRGHHRAARRALGVLLAALLVSVICGALIVLMADKASVAALPAWAWGVALAASIAILAAAIHRMVQLARKLRQARFQWAAKAAVGNMLKRLNFAGNRIFHDVAIDGAIIDHVVLGARGAFAINVVARPLPRQATGRATAELKNGKLWFAGNAEALPVGEAARNMTLLSGALTRLAGHRVPVRSVLVVPGWHCVPSDAGNHLVLNESSIAMVTSWNTPDAYLMDEDCLAMQAFLHEASRAPRMA